MKIINEPTQHHDVFYFAKHFSNQTQLHNIYLSYSVPKCILTWALFMHILCDKNCATKVFTLMLWDKNRRKFIKKKWFSLSDFCRYVNIFVARFLLRIMSKSMCKRNSIPINNTAHSLSTADNSICKMSHSWVYSE